jgi:hypothetical protein
MVWYQSSSSLLFAFSLPRLNKALDGLAKLLTAFYQFFMAMNTPDGTGDFDDDDQKEEESKAA